MSKTNILISLVMVTAACLANSAGAAVSTSLTKQCKPLAPDTGQEPKVQAKALSEATYKRLVRAQEFIAESNYPEAESALKSLYERTESREYDHAVVAQNLGYLYLMQDKHSQAIRYLLDAAESNQLPFATQQKMINNIARIYLGQEKYDQALSYMQRWFKNAIGPSDSDYALLASIYASKEQYSKAACPVFLAIERAKEPKEPYYQLLLQAHFELKDFQGTAAVLKEMVEHFPDKKDYWLQLSQVYTRLDRMADALAIAELAHLAGHITEEKDFKHLSSLYAFENIPYRSAEVLQEGIDKNIVEPNEKLLSAIATNWQAAYEYDKAVEAFYKTGELSDDGEPFLRAAQLLGEKEKWNDSISAYRKALQKGGLKDTGKAYFGLGVAYFNAGISDKAIEAMEQARKFDSQQRNASQWISYIRERMASR